MTRTGKKKKWLTALLLILLALFFVLGVRFYMTVSKFYDAEDDGVAPKKPPADERVNVLLLGIDTYRVEGSRADTIMVASLDRKTGHAALLSIPRDTRVEIRGRGLDKINHAHAFGGIPLMVETVESFLGIELHYYVRLNLAGFEKMVDLLGGVDIDVEPKVAAAVRELQPGPQRLNGAQALAYVRVRKVDSDFGRIQRQQKFLLSLADQALSAENIFRLPSFLAALGDNVSTNIPPMEAARLGHRLLQLNLDEIDQGVITGTGRYINGIYYLLVDDNEVQQLLYELQIKKRN